MRLISAAAALAREVTLMVNEQAVVMFDDERVVANSGVMLPALLAQRLVSSSSSDRPCAWAIVRALRIRGAR